MCKNREVAKLFEQWYRKENEKPLVQVFAPFTPPFTNSLDIDIPADQIGERKLRNIEAEIEAELPGDKLMAATVSFGPAFLPALAGAGFEYDEHTSWTRHIADEIDDVKISRFDPAHPLWVKYVERFEDLLKHWSWDTYIPGMTDLTGPLDILAGVLGPENLAMEMYSNPDGVRAAAADAARLYLDVHAAQLEMIRQAGLTEGVTTCFAIWMPGKGGQFSEDFSALCGERHFRDFFIEADSIITREMETSYLHTHSAAYKCMPAIVEIDNISSVEHGNDPNGPGADDFIASGKIVQDAGLPLQLSNWNRQLPGPVIRKMLDSFRPEGFFITLQASSIEEARELYAMGKGE